MPRGRPKKEGEATSERVIRIKDTNFGIGAYAQGWIVRQFYITGESHWGAGGTERYDDTYHSSFVGCLDKILDSLMKEQVGEGRTNASWEKMFEAWAETVKHVMNEAAQIEKKGQLQGIKKEIEVKIPKKWLAIK